MKNLIFFFSERGVPEELDVTDDKKDVSEHQMVGNQTGIPQSSCETMRGVPEELGPLGVTDDKKDVKKDGAEHQTGVAQPSSATTVIVAELAALAIEQAEVVGSQVEVTVEPEQLVGNRKDVTEEKIEGGGAQGDFTVEQAEVIGARRHMAEDDGPGEPNATSEDISSLSDGWVVKVGGKTLKCTACNVLVSLQATNKFGNMRRHLKSPAHIAKSSDSYTAQYKSLEAKFLEVFVHHGQEAHCSDCGKKGILMLAGKNLLRNAASHVESDRHRQCAKKSGGSTSKRITSFFTRGRKTSNEWLDYTICHGYANTETMFHENSKEVKVDLTLLHRDLDPGFDNGEMSWWAEPHHEGSSGMKGTFRCAKCKKVALTNDICSHCAAIPKLQSFRKHALLRQTRVMDKREATTVRNQYLIREELMNKCDSQSRKLGEDRAEKYFLKSKCERSQAQLLKLQEKLKEYSKHGAFKAITHQLDVAAAEGKLNDKTVLKDMLATIARNLNVKKEGKRYKASFAMFLETILMWGGPRLANFVAMNIGGPEIHSVYRWRKTHCHNFDLSVTAHNLQIIPEIMIKATTKKNIPRVPVLLAEDETAIVSSIHYCAERDVLLGFCGTAGINHQCDDLCVVPVGEGEEGYENIVNAFRTLKRGTHARAVIINPLHPELPKIPILIQPTCNRFDNQFVRRQWDTIEALYNDYLEDIVGPLIGNASDGDSRRRHLMLNHAQAGGERFQPIPKPDGFHLTAEKIIQDADEEGQFNIRRLGDQDYIHVHKKLVNHLFHEARVITLGNSLVHSNYLLLVQQMFDFHEHGLSREDVIRTDRQNWTSAQRISFDKVINCLQQVVDGSATRPADPGAVGTKTFLPVIWHYVEIFCSGTASLVERIHNAGLVCHFLDVWRSWVIRQPHLVINRHLISRESYQDTLLSCHFAVSLIMYMAVRFPTVPCHLDLTGTDVVESYFSKNGQWVGNQHTYSFGRMARNLRHMVRLEEIRVSDAAPAFAKPHPKGEVI